MPLQKEFQPNVTLQIIVVSKAKRATNFTDSNILFLSLLSCTYVRTILQYYCSSVLFLALLVSLKYYQTVHYINNVLSIQSIGSFCKKPKTRYVDISLLYNLMIIRVKKTWRERNSIFLVLLVSSKYYQTVYFINNALHWFSL